MKLDSDRLRELIEKGRDKGKARKKLTDGIICDYRDHPKGFELVCRYKRGGRPSTSRQHDIKWMVLNMGYAYGDHVEQDIVIQRFEVRG